MKLSNFLLLSGNDLPFPGARTTIRQPKLKEIALLGEEDFFLGCGMLNFSKDLLDVSDKNDLDNYTDFDILLTLITNPNQNQEIVKSVAALKFVLTLLFPERKITFEVPKGILLTKTEEDIVVIDATNFLEFKQILTKMFNLSEISDGSGFKPVGDFSERIAKKLKERHKQLAKVKGSKEADIFGRYISILAVGEQKDINELFQYTVYQLYDEIARFNAKRDYDTIFKAKLAGAQNLEEVQDWTLDLKEIKTNKKNK